MDVTSKLFKTRVSKTYSVVYVSEDVDLENETVNIANGTTIICCGGTIKNATLNGVSNNVIMGRIVLNNTTLTGNWLHSGTTRPSGSTRYKGMQFFDETLGKPIWYDGNSTTGWCDATGAAV